DSSPERLRRALGRLVAAAAGARGGDARARVVRVAGRVVGAHVAAAEHGRSGDRFAFAVLVLQPLARHTVAVHPDAPLAEIEAGAGDPDQLLREAAAALLGGGLGAAGAVDVRARRGALARVAAVGAVAGARVGRVGAGPVVLRSARLPGAVKHLVHDHAAQ